jgi:hypothetical protein
MWDDGIIQVLFFGIYATILILPNSVQLNRNRDYFINCNLNFYSCFAIRLVGSQTYLVNCFDLFLIFILINL